MNYYFLFLILLVSFLYASIGHGGASGYLALMTIFSFNPILLKSTALLLNVFVSGIAFLIFFKVGYFKWKILLPFIITSIPMAYIGANLKIDPWFYKIILSICLLFGILRILFIPLNENKTIKPLNFSIGLLIGAVLGFISGLIGIGGGIILSPILIIFKWANMKETAAVSALFILLNSLSGLCALSYNGINFTNEMIIMTIIALIGGSLGSYAGSLKFKNQSLKYALAIVMLIASIKLLFV